MRIAVPATITAGALAGHDRTAPIVDLGGETMGTIWSVRMAVPGGLDVAALEKRITSRFEDIIFEMSHWTDASVLSVFNQSAGHWIELPADFATVMATALSVARVTGGAFDPTIGRLAALWGFGPAPAMVPPQEEALRAALQAAGWRKLSFEPATRRIRQPGGLALDLSGIAKGFAVDAVAALLRYNGVRHCLVEIGGELVGCGIRPDGDPWWVDLESPPGMVLPPLRIALHQLAVATSGDYRRGAHTIDPRTGRPADNGVTSVSVIHSSAMLADVWATALTVLGQDEGLVVARREGLAARFVSRGGEALTPALQAMMT